MAESKSHSTITRAHNLLEAYSMQLHTWYLPAGVLALKGGSGMGSRVIRTQMSESEVYIHYMKCM